MEKCISHDKCVGELQGGIDDVRGDVKEMKTFLGIGLSSIEPPPDSFVGQFLSLKYTLKKAALVVCVVCITLIGFSYYVNRAPRTEVLQLTKQVEVLTETVKSAIK